MGLRVWHDGVRLFVQNVQRALEQAGVSLNDVARVTYVLPKTEEFSECWPILRKYFDDVRPAAMMLSAGLADPRMKIEIEVTACRRSSGQPRTRKATK